MESALELTTVWIVCEKGLKVPVGIFNTYQEAINWRLEEQKRKMKNPLSFDLEKPKQRAAIKGDYIPEGSILLIEGKVFTVQNDGD